MQKNHFQTGVAFALLISAMSANAQVTPKVPGETLEDGKQYVLFNKAQNSSQYMSRTGWDGALYFLGKDDSKYSSHALTAQKNDDGSWSFSIPVERNEETGDYDEDGNPIMEIVPGFAYMAVPVGTCNLNVKSDEIAKWAITPGDGAGYYHLTAGEGNNGYTEGMKLHLNAGGQYFVISEQYDGGMWWPDIYGGAERWEDEQEGEEYATPLDSISFNWAFVQVENVENYVQDMEMVSLINDLYDNYCNIEKFETGFKATYDAVAALYQSAEYDIDNDRANIIAMIAQKKALYAEIDKAEILNEEGDAALSAAIAAALSAFDSATEAEAVSAAITSLKKAEEAYSMGTGDLTALGTNMSFEDLESQNGAETSGVAGAPKGWNIYINGNQVVTADEVKTAGISAWHGVNSDSNGDIKDGKEAFGIWTSGVPTYEISQTIQGLENGTYIVTAGLMAGSNGNGSRLTTQRIFGNLNSTYYASEYDYNIDKLDNSEVFDFAGNEIITTDTEMRPVSVRAYVYDGTLTFGLRTDGNIQATNREFGNGAGGDGWFKVDNFTIQTEGYIPADALAVLNHYANKLDEYNDFSNYKMPKATFETLSSEVSKYQGFNEASAQSDINAAIVGSKALLDTVDEGVKAYETLKAAIEEHYENLNLYESKQGVGEYSDFITECDDNWYDGEYTAEEIPEVIKALNAALQECIQSDEIVEGTDLTEYISNPSFEDQSAQNNINSDGVSAPPAGWNLYVNGTQCTTVPELNAAGLNGWCAINSGDGIGVDLEDGSFATQQYTDGTHLWGIWNSTIPEIELSQTIKNVPAGTYTLTCDVLVQYNWAGYCITTQRIFANDYVAMYSYAENYENNLPIDAQAAAKIDSEASSDALPHLTYAGHECESPRSDYSHTVSLTFGLAEMGDIKIGFRTNNIDREGIAQGNGIGWFKLDNWTLHYDSATVPEGAEATSMASVSSASRPAAVKFYTVSGTPLASPQPGINIVQMSDGTMRKTFVK